MKKEIGFEEAKELRKNLLKVFHDYCAQNNLKYSMAYGTLLGAIRHKDMIPWDDDVDVAMPRKDIEKMRHCSLDRRYSFVTHRDDSNYKSKIGYFIDENTFSLIGDKVSSGIRLDVYPIDAVPDNYLRNILFVKRFFLQAIIRGNATNPNYHKGIKKILISILSFVCHLYGEDRALLQLQNLIMSYSNSSKEYSEVSVLAEFGYPICFPKSVISEFENYEYAGKMFKGFKDYNTILKGWYGDYMKLPPEDKRIPPVQHFKYYWR